MNKDVQRKPQSGQLLIFCPHTRPLLLFFISTFLCMPLHVFCKMFFSSTFLVSSLILITHCASIDPHIFHRLLLSLPLRLFLLRSSSGQHKEGQYEISWLMESHSHSVTLCVHLCVCGGVCTSTLVSATVYVLFLCVFLLVWMGPRMFFISVGECASISLCVFVTLQLCRPLAVGLIPFL